MTKERHLGGCPKGNVCPSLCSSELGSLTQIFLISGSPAALSAYELRLSYQAFPLGEIRFYESKIV